jgi:hypothetical protein
VPAAGVANASIRRLNQPAPAATLALDTAIDVDECGD